MQFINKKYSVKIPNNNVILYCTQKNIITVIGPLAKKSLKLKLKIEIFENKKIIQILSTPLNKLSNNNKKKINSLKGTTVALIKQLILETSSVLYKKLKFVGVGYRGFEVENFKDKLLMLKLGYSHSIYFKTPKNLNIFCLKLTKLFIYGNSYQDVTQTASLIRSYKTPEPYKGKGILYENEIIKLKKGKKNLK
jgi:large subunit ribosomal protein L6